MVLVGEGKRMDNVRALVISEQGARVWHIYAVQERGKGARVWDRVRARVWHIYAVQERGKQHVVTLIVLSGGDRRTCHANADVAVLERRQVGHEGGQRGIEM